MARNITRTTLGTIYSILYDEIEVTFTTYDEYDAGSNHIPRAQDLIILVDDLDHRTHITLDKPKAIELRDLLDKAIAMFDPD